MTEILLNGTLSPNWNLLYLCSTTLWNLPLHTQYNFECGNIPSTTLNVETYPVQLWMWKLPSTTLNVETYPVHLWMWNLPLNVDSYTVKSLIQAHAHSPHIWVWWPTWSWDQDHLNKLLSSILKSWKSLNLIGPVAPEEMFEIVDGQRMDVILLAHPWALGSGELINRSADNKKYVKFPSMQSVKSWSNPGAKRLNWWKQIKDQRQEIVSWESLHFNIIRAITLKCFTSRTR